MEIETEADLLGLIGESESIGLEFKGPDDFLSWPQGKANVTKSLSKAVSAFANTYGGQIVIGLKETRERPHRAESIEGVDPRCPAIETIQRIVESNIQPRLEGVRYRVIRLGGAGEGRVVYVISVPEGRTVHQANDKLYYGRSEFESVPLEDQLIRYKMVRERIAEATIDVVDVKVVTAADEHQSRQQELEERRKGDNTDEGVVYIPTDVRRTLEASAREFDEYSFAIAIRNTGAITIRDCLLDVDITGLPDGSFTAEGAIHQAKHRWLFRLAAANAIRTMQGHGSETAVVSEAKVFPTQQQLFPGGRLTFQVGTTNEVQNAILNWKLYLDDSPPLSGNVALGEKLKFASKA